MKILHINTVYNQGSTGRIVSRIHHFLMDKRENSYVIYGRGTLSRDLNVYKNSPEWEGKLQALYARITGDFYGGAIYSTYRLLQRIKKIDPDIVHLHVLNGNYVNNHVLLNYLAQHRYKVVITLHAEIHYTGLCEHAFDCEKWKTGCYSCPQVFSKYHSLFFDKTSIEWKNKLNAYLKIENISLVSVTKFFQERAKQSPMFPHGKFSVISNGIDIEVFKPTEFSYLRQKHNLYGQKVILHVTPSFKNPVKGGKYVLELAERLQIDPTIKFIIVGFDCWSQKLPQNVIPISHTESQRELAAYYSLADVTLLTSQRETFSLVCAESLSCGTPVIGFRASGPEEIAVEEYSEFVEYGDMDSLLFVVKKWTNKEKKSIEIVDKVDGRYSEDKMLSGYYSLYNEIVK